MVPYPQAHEYRVIVLPAAGAQLLDETRFFDARGSRRLVYPPLVSSDDLQELHQRPRRPPVLELIQQAEQSSVKLIADLDREYGTLQGWLHCLKTARFRLLPRVAAPLSVALKMGQCGRFGRGAHRPDRAPA